MDGGDEMFIGNKKKNPIDNDQNNNKKHNKQHKKNINKSLANAKLIQQLQSKKNSNQTQSSNNKQSQKQDAKIQKKIDHIKNILQHHKQSTILAALKKNNYDTQQALQQLFNTPADQSQSQELESFKYLDKNESEQTSDGYRETRKKAKKILKNQRQEIANNLLNQIYDNKQQIDPSQFQQLFAQITDIIQQEQKNNGMDLFQINQFIDDCYLIKNVILEDQNQIYIDENDQLCRQTQLFMEELIKNQVANQVKRQQDFPTPNSISKPVDNNKKSTIQQIQENYKKQFCEQQYFTPNKSPQIYHSFPANQSRQYSLFTISNNPHSYSDVLQLSKQYSDMGIDKLKFIYLRLEDINLCKIFLDKYYVDKKRQIKKQQKDNRVKNMPIRKNSQKLSYKRLQDQNFKNYTLDQIRDQLDHLFKRRNVFRMTRGRITNLAHRKQLQRLSRLDDPRIEKLSQAARFKTIQLMASGNPQYIDMHGYREQEVDELMYQIQKMIKQLFKKGSSKLETVKLDNNVYVVVKVMTGKGLHSKSRKSVLKPTVKEWCDRNDVKCNETQDTVNVYIRVR